MADLYGISVALIVAGTGARLATARRWKRSGRIPGAAARLLELFLEGDLGLVHPTWSGWRLVRGQLWTPNGWRIEPGEILALPFRYQQLRELERQVAAARARDLDHLRAPLADARVAAGAANRARS